MPPRLPPGLARSDFVSCNSSWISSCSGLPDDGSSTMRSAQHKLTLVAVCPFVWNQLPQIRGSNEPAGKVTCPAIARDGALSFEFDLGRTSSDMSSTSSTTQVLIDVSGSNSPGVDVPYTVKRAVLLQTQLRVPTLCVYGRYSDVSRFFGYITGKTVRAEDHIASSLESPVKRSSSTLVFPSPSYRQPALPVHDARYLVAYCIHIPRRCRCWGHPRNCCP
jgi:hypothetical protein